MATTKKQTMKDLLDAGPPPSPFSEMTAGEFLEGDYTPEERAFPLLVADELGRAKRKHPARFHSLHEAHSIIREEFDEFWDEVRRANRDLAEVLAELVQVAAMCQRAAEDCGLVGGKYA